MSTSVLIIVESSGKVPTLQKYLDSQEKGKYLVLASSGHVCDLPKKNLGFDPNNNFKITYEITENRKSTIAKLKSASRAHDEVILATDNDREGEAIAQHLSRELNLHNPDRITFIEITKDAIINALKNPRQIDHNMVNSQETRRVLDRMIGWVVSPVARQFVVPESSMGRIQSAVLLYLVNIERAIKNFKPTNHFGVESVFLHDPTNPSSMWSATWDASEWFKPDQQYWIDKDSALRVSEIKKLEVLSIENSVAERPPVAPLITSTLQVVAQNSLKLTPKQTMEIAQGLYEAGAITYMRTDSPNLSKEAYVSISKYAEKNNLPINPEQRMFKSKASAQEAHEAIRPTSFEVRQVGQGVVQDLYDLIWNRAVASQLKSATYSTKEVVLASEVDVVIDGQSQTKTATFIAKSKTLAYDGWLRLTEKDISDDELDEREELPNNPIPNDLVQGQVIDVTSSSLKEKKTTPPKRLTSSALTKRMESLGVGRPSTYATMDSTLLLRKYIEIQNSKLVVTDRGFAIIDKMAEHFRFIDIKYTADMESKLDEIAKGEDHILVTRNFWEEINQEVKSFTNHIISTLPQHKCKHCESLLLKRVFPESTQWRCTNKSCNAKYSDLNDAPNVELISKQTDHLCLECNRNLIFRKGEFNGRKYESFSCSGATDPLNRCFARYELSSDSPETPNFELYREQSKHRCVAPDCGRKLDFRTAHKGTEKEFKFWICSGNTNDNNAMCKAFYRDKNGVPDYELYEESHKHVCLKCGGFISKFEKKLGGFYWKCTNIPKNRKKQCDTFYSDNNGQPDFDAYHKNHTHKCFNCDSYLSSFIKKESKQPFWICSNTLCNIFFEDFEGEPNQEVAKTKYTVKCNKCKTGLLQLVSSSSGSRWYCSADTCKVSLPDIDGQPDFDFKPKATK